MIKPTRNEFFTTFEDLVSRIQFGTPLVIVNASSKQELYNKVFPYCANLQREFGVDLLCAEVYSLSLSIGALRIEVILSAAAGKEKE